MHATEANKARARVAVHIFVTGGTVHARRTEAFVGVVLAVFACESPLTGAGVVPSAIGTDSPVGAGSCKGREAG